MVGGWVDGWMDGWVGGLMVSMLPKLHTFLPTDTALGLTADRKTASRPRRGDLHGWKGIILRRLVVKAYIAVFF